MQIKMIIRDCAWLAGCLLGKMGKARIQAILAALLVMLCFTSHSAYGNRIKDIATLQGVRTNQLIGYGLVVGLDGTGDATNQALFTQQSFKTMLNKFGIRIPPGTNLQTKNIAAVMISSELPPFVKPGQTIDITASSIGNAKSLRGGTLLMTPLKGADGQVYAMAQGSLMVSGITGEGADGSKVTVNIPSVGRIPNGATVEKPAPTTFEFSDTAIFNLNQPDFTTAIRLADAVNSQLMDGVAKPVDAGSIKVALPGRREEQILFLSEIETLQVEPAQSVARVIVNSRTGTVVIGQNVRVRPAAVSHGNLIVTISEAPFASQPAPFSDGETVVVPDSQVQVNEEDNRAFLFDPGPSLDDIVQAVNSVGASPSDLAAILESLKEAGALQGELKVI